MNGIISNEIVEYRLELEQAANQSAISSLQAGDKCMVKLVNNYLEKWTLAYVQSMHSDSANVFVPELNERLEIHSCFIYLSYII